MKLVEKLGDCSGICEELLSSRQCSVYHPALGSVHQHPSDYRVSSKFLQRAHSRSIHCNGHDMGGDKVNCGDGLLIGGLSWRIGGLPDLADNIGFHHDRGKNA
ncbi:hypothetical protein N7490_001020 [Penicillium lividum]|nr:hypothetical protein N7490_001020 [Penicillium lividum]